MRSETNDMDEFFRKQNEEHSPDMRYMDVHWQNMRSMMPQSKSKPNPGKYLIPVAASLLLVASVAIVTRFNKDDVNTNVAGSKMDNRSKAIPTVPSDTSKNIRKESYTTAASPGTVQYKNTINYVTKQSSPAPGVTINLATADPSNNSAPANNEVFTSLSDQATKNARALKEFFSVLQPAAQTFIIDNKRDTLLFCKEGTKLFIPAGSFETVTGSDIHTQVKVEVTEHYSYADMIGSKLNTLSNGKRLGTAGMILLKATADKADVKIKKGKSLNLKMPGKVNPQMQLFEGRSEPSVKTEISETADSSLMLSTGPRGINWVAAGQQQLYYDPRHKHIKVLNLEDYCTEVIRSPIISFSREPQSRTIAKFQIQYNCPFSTSEVKQMLEAKYPFEYDEIRVRREWKPMSKRVRASRSYTPYLNETWFVGDSIYVPIKYAMRRKYITQEDSLAYEAKWKKQLEERMKRNEQVTQYLDATAEYSFNITNMGWINCDRYLNYPPSRLTEFVVNTSMESDFAESSAVVIFKADKNLMTSKIVDGKLSLQRVPLGDKVTVVALVVKEGQVYSCVENLTITKEPVKDIQFKRTSPEEFKQQLRSLGTVVTK